MVTAAGQIVLLDAIFAEALERLQLTRRRLWTELRLAFPDGPGAPSFDKGADLTQVALAAATLIVGRLLRDDEWPDGLAALQQEIVEIASIRASKGFADGIDAFFSAALPLPARKTSLTSADEAAIDLRKLLRKEVGIATCRTALVEFVQQVETIDKGRPAANEPDAAHEPEHRRGRGADRAARDEAERKAREEAELKAREEAERQAREQAERQAREEAERQAREAAELKVREEAEHKAREEAELKAREEAELKARQAAELKAREEAERKAREEAELKARQAAELKAREEAERKAREEAELKARQAAELKAREAAELKARQAAELKAREEAERKARQAAELKAREEAERKAREEAERKARKEAERKTREEAERKAREEAERKAREEAERKAREEAERKAREEAERKAREEAERKAREEAERKTREEAERKSQAEAALASALPPADQAKGAWLVAPHNATAFNPAVEPTGTPAADRAYPIYQPPAETQSWTPEAEPPPAIEIGSGPTPNAFTPPLAAAGIRLKHEKGAASAFASRADSRHEPTEDMTAADAYNPFSIPEEPQVIPWKLIAAGVVLIAATFALTRGYMPSDIPAPSLVALQKPLEIIKKPPPPAAHAGSGSDTHLAISSEPVGARILLDGKFVGATPMTIDEISAGRHVVTLQGSGGAIKRTVRIEPGKTTTLDVPVFSGFALIVAPFVVEVAEGGRSLGTSEEQIMLGPGHHDLHLENKDLNYSGTHGVDVEPGETTRITVDPKGRANINAIPWAEVYIDGESAGQTPLANVPIRLGVREIVFKNPQFPERKVVVTIKSGDAPTTTVVDFTKDKVQ
ncbi:MAG TPA: PEGA domain-containing protein [Vicinamibacterales bacterium]